MSFKTEATWKCDMCLTKVVVPSNETPRDMLVISVSEIDNGSSSYALLHMCRDCVGTMQTNAAIENLEAADMLAPVQECSE